MQDTELNYTKLAVALIISHPELGRIKSIVALRQIKKSDNLGLVDAKRIIDHAFPTTADAKGYVELFINLFYVELFITKAKEEAKAHESGLIDPAAFRW